MGLEAACRATLDGESSSGKALLETSEVVFRGDFRARVPLNELESVSVAGKTLTLKWRGGALALALGADLATKWAAKIQSPPSRLAKLGVKRGVRVALVGDFSFDADFEAELTMGGDGDAAATARTPVDVLFYAARTPHALERIPMLAKRLHPSGALWIVRPKGRDTLVTEAATREAGLAAGLVDVKVAAFSPTHSALKFVIPLAKRPR
jgi:hypothetical protein